MPTDWKTEQPQEVDRRIHTLIRLIRMLKDYSPDARNQLVSLACEALDD